MMSSDDFVTPVVGHNQASHDGGHQHHTDHDTSDHPGPAGLPRPGLLLCPEVVDDHLVSLLLLNAAVRALGTHTAMAGVTLPKVRWAAAA